MYDYSFKRIEEKYLLTYKEKCELLSRINDYIDKDKFFISHIHNIYFDTDNSDLIINSLDKPIFKDKFRARCYGGKDVYLEAKVKYKGVVGKRRVKVTINDFYSYINGGNLVNDNQVFKEISYYFDYYKLKPSIYIAYDRESYKGKEDSNLRITFDSNLRSRRDNLVFIDDCKMNNYFDGDFYIMEIKSIMAMPLWLVRILSDMNIRPISFSKYGKIYEKEMKERVISYA